jgi:fibronectin type III domain protein
MTAGHITSLHAAVIGKTSFTVRWNPAPGAVEGYAYIVRDLDTHTQVVSGYTKGILLTVRHLHPDTEYNFGIQGLPGGPGSNIHILTKPSTSRVQSVANRVPSGTGGIAGVGYRAFARALMLRHGWGLGQQWTDFQWIVMAESGWNSLATNPQSGAFGIAQALGHGTANTRAADGENNYGNFSTSDAICRAANSGNGFAQLVWMCNYIATVYGSPSGARARYNLGY